MNLPKVTIGFFALILGVLLLQSQNTEFIEPRPPPEPGELCKGVPLVVDYPYQGGLLEPHACKVQCEDDIQRYIYYSNNMATQCDEPPSCLDWGEDHGVTCLPQTQSPA